MGDRVLMRVWRGDASGGEFRDFRVEAEEGEVVLDVLHRIQAKQAGGRYRFMQEDIDRVQEFRKCIECFLCQDVCHVIRDHPENAENFAGPRFFIRYAELEMHPLDTNDRTKMLQDKVGLGYCNI